MEAWPLVAALGIVAAIGLAILLSKALGERNVLRERMRPLLDVEAEARKAKETAERELRELERKLGSTRTEMESVRTQYSAGLVRLEELSSEISSLEENLEHIEDGFYRPHFSYEDSEAYKEALVRVRAEQRELAQSGRATYCATTWQVGGSAREGERMVKQTRKLILRAFNAEAEAAISNVSWNNYETMKARIIKAKEVLNKHGTVLQVSLTETYCDSRLEELRLVYEAAEKKKEERERQREQRAALKEEEKVQRELARAQEEASKEEAKFEKALAKARAEVASAKEEERSAMSAKIAELEAALAAAHDRKERAIAQAQLTRVGHVYIISNIGAFGEGIVKIGMTRRLEPEERIKELGDASVPFPFDMHALVYSEDAPALESRLHEHFWERRLNWSNDRKEFFRVTLSELESAIQSFGLKTTLAHVPEAREYRETVALKERASAPKGQVSHVPRDRFPDDPFASAT